VISCTFFLQTAPVCHAPVCHVPVCHAPVCHAPDTQASRVEPGYNDIGLYDTSPIASDILWYQLIPHC
jgi:hypothetical protein